VEVLDEGQSKVVLCARVDHHIVFAERIKNRRGIATHIDHHSDTGIGADGVDFFISVQKKHGPMTRSQSTVQGTQNMIIRDLAEKIHGFCCFTKSKSHGCGNFDRVYQWQESFVKAFPKIRPADFEVWFQNPQGTSGGIRWNESPGDRLFDLSPWDCGVESLWDFETSFAHFSFGHLGKSV
jgi:hypothetical protein